MPARIPGLSSLLPKTPCSGGCLRSPRGHEAVPPLCTPARCQAVPKKAPAATRGTSRVVPECRGAHSGRSLRRFSALSPVGVSRQPAWSAGRCGRVPALIRRRTLEVIQRWLPCCLSLVPRAARTRVLTLPGLWPRCTPPVPRVYPGCTHRGSLSSSHGCVPISRDVWVTLGPQLRCQRRCVPRVVLVSPSFVALPASTTSRAYPAVSTTAYSSADWRWCAPRSRARSRGAARVFRGSSRSVPRLDAFNPDP